MTNVPENIRTAIADAYKLFDVSFNMDGSDKAWEQYWTEGNKLVIKYGDDIPLLEILKGYATLIETVVKKRNKNESLMWKPDEEYPYPRKEQT